MTAFGGGGLRSAAYLSLHQIRGYHNRLATKKYLQITFSVFAKLKAVVTILGQREGGSQGGMSEKKCQSLTVRIIYNERTINK